MKRPKPVDLVWLGPSTPPSWELGEVLPTRATVPAVAERMSAEAKTSRARSLLFWDGSLGAPEPARVEETLSHQGDLWHAGLKLGMAGLPRLMDFVHPTWMLTRDPDPNVEATSWRLSLRACLVPSEILRRMGGIRREFGTLEGAGLELGHRLVTRGVLTRHAPNLLAGAAVRPAPISLPFEDEFRFISYRFGRFWSRWCAARATASGEASPLAVRAALRRIGRDPNYRDPEPLHAGSSARPGAAPVRVSVLIPTLDRYSYLRTLLAQLSRQTVAPLEVLVVDQTPVERRDTSVAGAFPGLPLTVLYRDRAGQCSSRNSGLDAASGDFVLLLDDDVEIAPDLIARHLASLERFRADASCGVSEEKGAGALPPSFTLIRASDVFPAGNSLVRREALARSGLFDLAYEHGPRADRDLGMRIYLSGGLMVLNPEISVFHHHAPAGGLRAHKARVVTYASSSTRLTHRHLPTDTEIYLAKRYFRPRQVREMLFRRSISTLSIKGSFPRKAAKLFVGLVLLPDSLWRVRRNLRRAAGMLRVYPEFPYLRPEKTRAAAAVSER